MIAHVAEAATGTRRAAAPQQNLNQFLPGVEIHLVHPLLPRDHYANLSRINILFISLLFDRMAQQQQQQPRPDQAVLMREFQRAHQRRLGPTVDERSVILAMIRQNAMVLELLSDEYKDDEEIVLESVRSCYFWRTPLQFASPRLRNDRDFVAQVIYHNGRNIWYASRELQEDRPLVMQALSQDGEVLQSLPHHYREDREAVRTAVRSHGFLFELASESLRADWQIALEAIKSGKEVGGSIMKMVADGLRNDPRFVLQAVRVNGLALEHVADEYKDNRKYVMAAVQQNGHALLCANPAFKDDVEIVAAAIRSLRHHPSWFCRGPRACRDPWKNELLYGRTMLQDLQDIDNGLENSVFADLESLKNYVAGAPSSQLACQSVHSYVEHAWMHQVRHLIWAVQQMLPSGHNAVGPQKFILEYLMNMEQETRLATKLTHIAPVWAALHNSF